MQARLILALGALLLVIGSPGTQAASRKAKASGLSEESVRQAVWRRGGSVKDASLLLKLQILLDRSHASPGEIDAKHGENTRKAIAAFRKMRGLDVSITIDASLWAELSKSGHDDVLKEYIITDKDVEGPFLDKLPDDWRDRAKLKQMGYLRPEEALGERFHVSPSVLRLLNPSVDFSRPGTRVLVPNVQRDALPKRVFRIEVDAQLQTVTAIGGNGEIVAVYPATVGSNERPSPRGQLHITRVAKHPTYEYDPANNLDGVNVAEKLELPSGPNNPVGTVWIALSEKSYGIHGTPDPDLVSKRASHGCIRLTNWDAMELAQHVRKGTPVVILDGTDVRDRSGRSQTTAGAHQ